MKRLTITLLMSLLLTLLAGAQDFKLYYAKNVTDVTQFRNLRELSRQLHWHEVSNGAIDGNLNDVRQVKDMLSETRMKGLDDQRLFWKMRDEMLLCFRIEDPTSKTSSFRVEVNYGKNSDGKDIKKQMTTREFFFANMPLSCDSVSISVWRVKNPSQRINFRYWVYDWDDDNVYIFQLDQKRQSTGDTYKMEYVMSHSNREGDIISESHTLELKETKFQSFYVPQGHTLTHVYFLTGNEQEGNVKLDLDLDNIHPGIDVDDQLETPSLLSTFKLAKHENREMMNFNWIGTGLFEKFDTLYVKLFNDKGKPISKATMNVHRVDEDGDPVPDNTLCYLGYDAGSKFHKVLTYGHPAYVEILSDGFLPLVYRYKGAADKTSRIVSEDLCSAKITMRPGNADAGGIAISDQYFRYLEDEAIAVTRIDPATGDTIEYAVVSVKEVNISGKIPSDQVSFMDNAGNDYPKLYNNKPIQKLAQFEVVFSAPKGGSTPQSRMTVTEMNSNKTHDAVPLETSVISAARFSKFSRDYYFVRYDMSDAIPYNEPCKMVLTTPSATYNKFPMFYNSYQDNEQVKEEATKRATQVTSPPDGRKDAAGMMGGMNMGLQIPLDVKANIGFLKIKSGTNIDFIKQTYNTFICLYVGDNNEGKDKPTKDRLKSARDNAKQVQNFRWMDVYSKGEGKDKTEARFSLANPEFKYDDWVVTEMEGLFNVHNRRVGWYYEGGGKLALKMPLWHSLINFTELQLSELSGYVTGGWGFFFSPDMGTGFLKKINEYLKPIKLEVDLGAQVDLNARLDLGIKSYGKRDQYELIDANDKGAFANFTVTGLLSGWANLSTHTCPFANLEFGLRAGIKLQFVAGGMYSFGQNDVFAGLRAVALGGVQAHFSVRSFLYDFSGRWGFHAGVQKLIPDNNRNPFHQKFPFWLPDKVTSPQLIGEKYRPLRAPEPSSLGQSLVTGVFYDADPHFIDGRRLVYNDLGSASDYNDDQVKLATIGEEAVTGSETLSIPGSSAGQHMRSKLGTTEMVVYQQTTRAVDHASLTDETKRAVDQDMMAHTQIKAAIRQPDGTWKQTVVTPDDGVSDRKPVVTVQENGKAAVVYQHGTMEAIDETISTDSVWNQRFVGELLMRTYEPATGWSQPVKVFDITKTTFPLKYDLIMRNDTVLVGATMQTPENAGFFGKNFRYAWKPLKSSQVRYADGNLRVVDFYMNRVGKHGVTALLYERPDSTREIYIKTINMDSSDDGLAGSDLGIGRSFPNRVKIICDRSSEEDDDFAVLWTEPSTTVRDAENGDKALKEYATVINAVRVHLTNAPQMTYPLTVGVERDSLQLGDFDGYLDDASIQTVYTLTHPQTHAAVIMHSRKEFTNSFESDVTYSREALLGSSTLPVNVYIHNTGTSAINAATVTINGERITIPNVLVQPLQEQIYVVQYPIHSDFDGYMHSTVEVEYANVFKAQQQVARRAVPRNLLRQSRSLKRERVAAGLIDCNVVSRSVDNGVNTFVIEVVDHSSRGLTPGTAVQVAAYTHPSALETIAPDAKVLIHPADFTLTGGVRKAYAEVTVSGIMQPVDGYIAAHIVDLKSDEEKDSEDDAGVRVDNSCNIDSPSYVLFHPTGEATGIEALSGQPAREHRISATVKEGGILLGRLQADDNIRVFSSSGLTIYMNQATSDTHFVPLRHHDVYIISAGGEVFKFTY